MKEPQWVLRETVLALQEQLLAEFGGLAGVRAFAPNVSVGSARNSKKRLC